MTSTKQHRCRINFLLVLSIAMVGCQPSGPQVAPVEGVVLLDGKPVDAAGVLFSPLAGGMSASGTTRADGHFEMQSGQRKGALLGEHQVVITKSESVGATADEGGTSGLLAPGWKLINHLPEKYGDPARSGLTFVVKKGKNICRFELTSE